MKRVLVTGASGFVGTNLIRIMDEETRYKVITANSSVCNLTKQKETEDLIGRTCPDIVVHLAASVGGIGANKDNPGKFIYDNLAMGVNLIEASRRGDVEKFIMIGTVCSYPKFTNVPFKEEDLWKGYPEETNAPYGIAKKTLMEMLIAYKKQYGFNGINLIPTNLYGPQDNFNLQTSHIIPAIIRKIYEAQINKREEITIWGTGSVTREFLYVDDLCRAILLAIEKLNDSQPVNIGTGIEISIKDVIMKVCEIMQFDGKLIWDASKPDGQPRRCLDVSRAKDMLGFQATTSLEDGLKNCVEWFQQLHI